MSLAEVLREKVDAKEFSANPLGDDIAGLNCGQPTCKPGPCRGCKPTCASIPSVEEPAPATKGKK